jgi:hypothetical protein
MLVFKNPSNHSHECLRTLSECEGILTPSLPPFLPYSLTIPSVMGTSALLVLTIWSLSPFIASQVHPLPKFPFESAANCFL